ncbi:hypothetical protein IFM89_007580 [Coptis chinensis]|uniref:Uncharacterized protein n=1 Tax=Coptis chinensis TaxID=261450 RepID=A0A835GVF2_9MAGN|nr:hypothetical protein IFM89_007580 [Coptis chinensis]
MCFETLEAAKQFYIDYGKSFGFSPVIRSSEKSVSRSDEVSSALGFIEIEEAKIRMWMELRKK